MGCLQELKVGWVENRAHFVDERFNERLNMKNFENCLRHETLHTKFPGNLIKNSTRENCCVRFVNHINK